MIVGMHANSSNALLPPATIGIIGGGQLGKMIAMEAKRMGYHVYILDPNPLSPAGQVADRQIVAGFSDASAIRELVSSSDVSTFEFEHIDAETLESLELEGYAIYPSGSTLKIIQDKYAQKKMLKEIGICVPDFMAVTSYSDLMQCADTFGFPFVVKFRRGGYDGKGNRVIHDVDELAELGPFADGEQLMAEKLIDFKSELSAITVRAVDGQIKTYPIVENVHKQSILRITKVPADISGKTQRIISGICESVMDAFRDCGVFCIELFLAADGEIYVNEIAPRPHNSGHYSIEACVTSQFEQLIRVLARLPLGSCRLRSPCAMANILGTESDVGDYTFSGLDNVLKEDDLHLHIYGKEESAYMKKIGHITVLDDNTAAAEQKCLKALQNIKVVITGHQKEHAVWSNENADWYHHGQ